MPGWVGLCTECQEINLGSYTYCQSCRYTAYGGPPVRQTAGAPVKIVDSKLQERVAEVLEAMVGKARPQRKCRVADNFDAFLRARTSIERG